MKVFKIILVTLLSLAFLIGATLFLVGYLKPQPGGIYVDSVPVSNVYINGKYVDKTPYKNTFETGKVKVKLVPNDANMAPYETDVMLNPGVQSVITYKFGVTEAESSGYILSFDKDTNKTSGAVIVTNPDNSEIFIDDVVQGFAPHKTGQLTPGKHKIGIKKLDYQDINLTVTTYDGYTLNAFIKLPKAPAPTPSPEPTPSTKIYIEILNTPTGFLRVRTQSGSKGEEIAEVKPHEKFLFLEEDTESGWYKIQYSDPKAGLPNGIQGWVSNQYSKKIDE